MADDCTPLELIDRAAVPSAQGRKILVIGIGAGDPNQVTAQAAQAMNATDVFFVVDKGDVKDELVALRTQILDSVVDQHSYRIVELAEPFRDRTAADYEGAVADWHARRAALFEQAFTDELDDDGVGAFLVWGDPALYDSTLRVFDLLRERGKVEFDVEVIPGITSVQTLAAAHQLILNRIGEPIAITTGRRLAQGWPEGFNDVVVMLDAGCTFTRFAGPQPDGARYDLFWGAYLGTPDQILASGPVDEIAAQVTATRSAARERKGWIMDTYLLRRNP